MAIINNHSTKTLLVNNKGEISINSSVKVTAKILSHELDKKIIVFKQKRRKGYQKKNGHKQAYTKIVIQDLKSAAKTTKKKTNFFFFQTHIY